VRATSRLAKWRKLCEQVQQHCGAPLQPQTHCCIYVVTSIVWHALLISGHSPAAGWLGCSFILMSGTVCGDAQLIISTVCMCAWTYVARLGCDNPDSTLTFICSVTVFIHTRSTLPVHQTEGAERSEYACMKMIDGCMHDRLRAHKHRHVAAI